jgi:hypothetical protein
LLQAKGVPVSSQFFAQVKRRVAGALGVILMGNRCAEERHDAVARVLVHRALEAVDAVRENLEEAVQDAVPCFGIDLLGEIQRSLHVGEEDGHLLALAFQGALGGEDLLGEVLGGVVAGRAHRGGRGALPTDLSSNGRAALPAEIGGGWVITSAGGTDRFNLPPALDAEERIGRIGVRAGGTVHGFSSLRWRAWAMALLNKKKGGPILSFSRVRRVGEGGKPVRVGQLLAGVYR